MFNRPKKPKRLLHKVRNKHERLQVFDTFMTYYSPEMKMIFVFDGHFSDWTDAAIQHHIKIRLLAMHEE